jgi:hypothetical protein
MGALEKNRQLADILPTSAYLYCTYHFQPIFMPSPYSSKLEYKRTWQQDSR